MTDLAVVIVSWNVRALLAECLRSVQSDLARSQRSGEVWVVDNNSGDGSAEMVRRDFPDVRLIASETNVGFAGGNNLALRAIGFDSEPGRKKTDPGHPKAVLLLNPDTVVQAGALQIVSDFLDNHRLAGVVGPQLAFGDGTFQHGAFAWPGLWQLIIELLPVPGRLVESRLNGRYPRPWYEAGEPFEIGHPLGAAMAVRGEAIAVVGLLDERFRMYTEEVDWARRIVSAGWRAYCVPKAKITHFGGQSTEQIKMESFINLWTSRYLFYRKHYPSLKVWLASQIVRRGMRRKMKQDKVSCLNDWLSQAELNDRLRGYQHVIEIWQGDNPRMNTN